ncbi:MAG: 50S ribosomal protein L25 [Candidatus Margulisiibacteriota bacterium]
MEKIELEVEKREEFGRRLKKLRSQGFIPAIIYGRKISPLAIAVDKKVFVKNILESEAGMNAIVTLKVKGEEKKGIAVLTHGVQKDPLTGEIIHIDFRHIVMDEVVKTKVPVELVGVPTGVKDGGGVLVHGLREVEVECLPTDIPDKFEVDVTQLKIGDSLHVSDIPRVEKVKILSNPTEMIANCSPPTKEEVVAPAAPTPEEVAAAEAAPAVAEEEVKEKSPPGAPPPKPKGSSA